MSYVFDTSPFVGMFTHYYPSAFPVFLSLDRGLVTAEEYRERAREWADQRKGGAGGGGNYCYTQIAYLGPQYINLALGAYHRNRFDDVKLAEYLNIKPKNVDKFQETFLRRGA